MQPFPHSRASTLKAMLLAFITLMGVGFYGASLHAQNPKDNAIKFDFDLNVIPNNRNLPDSVVGKLRITNFDAGSSNCLFIPYNWSGYGLDRGSIKRFNDITSQRNVLQFTGGGTSLTLAAPAKIISTPMNHFLRVELPIGWTSADTLEFQINSRIPKLAESSERELFFDGFLPVIADECLVGAETSLSAPKAVDFAGTIKFPAGWEYTGTGTSSDSVATISSSQRSLAFVLTKGLISHTETFGALKVNYKYSSPEFKDVTKTVSAALPIIQEYLGAFPFKTLNIIETDELQRYSIPEMISINRPKQEFANRIQKDWLNWIHWTAVTQLVRQWFGASIDSGKDDEWLISGLVEFLTLETLQQISPAFDLFKEYNKGGRFLSFNYLQMSEFTAASLRRLSPYTTLTDSDLKSLGTQDTQHGLSYIRAAFSLRQIMHLVGKKEFAAFLRAFYLRYQNQAITPLNFYQFVNDLPSPFSSEVRQSVSKGLLAWWTDSGWPDFSIESFESNLEGASHRVRVVAEQTGSVDYPPMIQIKDQAGNSQKTRALRGADGLWVAEFRSPFKPEKALVDPDHETFDSNRFDNKTGMPSLVFFPGTVETIHDDRYSVVWFPYGYRLPGEPAAIGIGSAIFKYVQSGILGRIEHAPSTNQWFYQLRLLYALPDWALKGELSVNYSFENDRVVELNAIRSPILDNDSLQVSGQVKVRNRDHPGDKEQTHQTFGADLNLRPKGQSLNYFYDLSTESEISPEQGQSFSFQRNKVAAMGIFNFTERSGIMARFFRGKTIFSGSPPDSAKFKPNEIKEANLKIDIRGLDKSADIVAGEASIALPFYLPIPESTVVLSRQIQWRVYADWGKAYDFDIEYRSKGLGVVLPLGGDISGVGSLAVTRFTFLAILSSSAGSETKKKPGFVFDITGEL